jgi:hypothetical protein
MRSRPGELGVLFAESTYGFAELEIDARAIALKPVSTDSGERYSSTIPARSSRVNVVKRSPQ